MKIDIEAARDYWRHPSQESMGHTCEDLPEWAEYWADSGVCIMAHPTYWPGVLMLHLGVKPEAWGSTVEPVKRLLSEIWAEKEPLRLIAWLPDGNRLALSVVLRAGAEIDGKMPLEGGDVIQVGWRG